MLPVVNPEVIYQSMSDGAVLFSTRDEVYFGLNPVGARVWEALPPANATWDALYAAVQAQYPEVDPDTLRADVKELVEELLSRRLLLPHKPSPSRPAA